MSPSEDIKKIGLVKKMCDAKQKNIYIKIPHKIQQIVVGGPNMLKINLVWSYLMQYYISLLEKCVKDGMY